MSDEKKPEPTNFEKTQTNLWVPPTVEVPIFKVKVAGFAPQEPKR